MKFLKWIKSFFATNDKELNDWMIMLDEQDRRNYRPKRTDKENEK